MSFKVELSEPASMQYDKFYRVKKDRVIVEGMYHEPQDYEKVIE